jgi:iron complex outermembrane receptor protein
MLRGSFGISFRAPTFVELFKSPQERLMFLVDSARCALTNAPLDCVPAPYDVVSGGNDSLKPEEGQSWFLGSVWSPAWARNLDLSIDLWRFDHNERIIELGAQFIIDELGLNPDLVLRGPPLPTDPPGTPGRIQRVERVTLNADKLSTQGVDLGVRYRLSVTGPGDVDINMSLTYLDEYIFGETTNGELLNHNLAGTAEIFPLPRLRSNMTMSWSRGAHRWTSTLHYAGSYRSPLNRVVSGVETDARVDIDGHLTLDLQYEGEFSGLGNGVLRVGCQNCTDAKPPTYNYTISGEQLHDPRGAIVYLRWLQPFP